MQITFSTTPEQKRLAELCAEANRWSVSQVCALALEEYLSTVKQLPQTVKRIVGRKIVEEEIDLPPRPPDPEPPFTARTEVTRLDK